MDLGLKGKKAIVTGGTRGIGRRIVNLLAEEGVDVGICSRKQEEVDEAVATLTKQGVKVTGGVADVGNSQEYKAWLEKAAKDLGGCDIFVPNVSGGGGDEGEASWVKCFEVDMMGAVRGVEVLMPHLKKSGQGAVVMISSTNAIEEFMGAWAYDAMKAALINYTKKLSLVAIKDAVRVNCVCPGPVYFKDGPWDYIKENMSELYDWAIGKLPAGEMTTPEEIANVVAFLASPRASAMTGANIVVDKGFTKGVRF